jgi:hypothetical protein
MTENQTSKITLKMSMRNPPWHYPRGIAVPWLEMPSVAIKTAPQHKKGGCFLYLPAGDFVR